MVIKNKRGWMEVMEVFFSILIITSVLILALNAVATPEKKSEEIYKEQSKILKEIQLNENMRNFILEGNQNEINNFIDNKKPVYLECQAVICDFGSQCDLEEIDEDEIYTKSILITANENSYNPKELKLFCWEG